MLLTGVVSLLSLASLHQVGAAAGADSTALLTSGASFVGTYNAAFLIGGTLMPAINALLLGYLMYRSSLVPRLIPAIGLVGGVLMTSSVIGQILGINEKISVWSLIALLPIFSGSCRSASGWPSRASTDRHQSWWRLVLRPRVVTARRGPSHL